MTYINRGSQKYYPADGKIDSSYSIHYITKATAIALTINAPDIGQDGQIIHIVSLTDAAHEIVFATVGFNGGGGGEDTGTFGANAGNAMTLVASGGVWYTLNLLNVTLA